jgi:hypothetical protein
LFGKYFDKGFLWLKGVFGKHVLKPILAIVFKGRKQFAK